MDTVRSQDGTAIAYTQAGALCSRSFGTLPKLVPRLARRFTGLHDDRRGLGHTLPWPSYLQYVAAILGDFTVPTLHFRCVAIKATASAVEEFFACN
jgi:hypothetical protein